MSRTLAMQTPVSVTLNSSGNGTAQLGPKSPGETWNVTVVSVACATNVKEAQCRIYAGSSAIQQNFVDGTLSGSTGDSTDRVSQPLYAGEYIFAVWSGGDASTTATMNVQGTRIVA